MQQGIGAPVVMIHGVAASLHDWDDLAPILAQNGYASHALDLLGHGQSPKPDSRSYHVDWLFDYLCDWIESLRLKESAVVIGHSLGGYLALEYARRFPLRTRSLILVNPFYTLSQLPLHLRQVYSHPIFSRVVSKRLPEWMFRLVVDATSVSMGHSSGAVHSLSERVRAQTALDYTRTAPGVYNIPNTVRDLTDDLSSITTRTLVVWGERDQTLFPSSFPLLVSKLPHASGKSIRAGHVPHQSNADEFNQMVLEFLGAM